MAWWVFKILSSSTGRKYLRVVTLVAVPNFFHINLKYTFCKCLFSAGLRSLVSIFALGMFPCKRTWKITGLMGEVLVSRRCAQGPASPGDQGRHHAPARREPGGPADAPLLPERCHRGRQGEPDDPHQPGRLLGAFPLPPQHSEERELLPEVRVQCAAHAPVTTRCARAVAMRTRGGNAHAPLFRQRQLPCPDRAVRVFFVVLIPESSKTEFGLLPQRRPRSSPLLLPSVLLSPGAVAS